MASRRNGRPSVTCWRSDAIPSPAKGLGLEVPLGLSAGADEVIE
jgi:hypothetical protein